MGGYAQSFGGISIHALLAESDESTVDEVLTNEISIHALLAESDPCPSWAHRTGRNFYPRSPCGERPLYNSGNSCTQAISIHALLAESDSKSAQNSGALLRI